MDIHKMMQAGDDLNMEELEKNLLDLDSEFHFKCRRCGKCCKNQDTIIFSTRDIFNIAHKLGKTMMEVVGEYAEVYIGHNSRIPIVHMVPSGPSRSCPLLKDGLCSVHDCKPTVCALFPLGRVAVNKQKEDGTVDPRDFKIRYILNDIVCGSAKRVNTVRSWLARFGIPEQDEFFILWNEVMMESGELVRLLEKKKAPEPLLQLIWNIQMNALYLQYDPSQDFFPQFQANAGRLLPLTKAIQERVSSDQDGISLLLKGLEAGLHGQIGSAR